MTPDPVPRGYHSPMPRRLARLVAVLALLAVQSCAPGPEPLPVREPPRPTERHAGAVTGPPLASINTEPTLRVRVARGERVLSLQPVDRGDDVWLSPGGPVGGGAQRFTPPVTVTSTGEAFRVEAADGRSGTWTIAALHAGAESDLKITTAGDAAYPGTVQLHHAPGGIDAINHVPLETYLPGVLDRELYPNWRRQAFEAQAVAARSYALFEMSQSRRNGRRYDLESTTASQVYGGTSTNPTARAAVASTRGRVLAYDGRVVPAFYSSTTGGRGQDAAAVFTRIADIPPLRGRSRDTWGSISPHWTWGPIRRDLDTLARRLAAWGEANDHPVANLRGIRGLAVTARSRAGRPAAFRVTDTAGTSYTLRSEQFRFACNFATDGSAALNLPPLERDQRVMSSDLRFEPAPGGDAVVITGRGWGHGVGLGQWGAQHLATRGYDARAILAYYYPDAAVVRLY